MKRHSLVLALTSALLTVGCGEGAGPTSNDGPATTIELFSWWTAPGEAEALDALLAAQRAKSSKVQFKNIAVVNTGLDPQEELFRRMGLNPMGEPDPSLVPSPPDLMQWDLYSVEAQWRSKGVKFASLSAIHDSEGWRGKYYPFLTKDMEFEGQILSQPVGLHRENSLFFNRQMLRDQGIAESSLDGWDGLLAACVVLKQAGKTCISATQEGWVNWILFRSVAAMTLGPAKFHALFHGTGDRNDPAVATAVERYKSLFDQGYVGGWDNATSAPSAAHGWANVRHEGWDEAAKDVHRGRAAFFFHGDWAVGLYKSLGWTSADLGVRAAPGSNGLFVYGADGFLVPATSKNPGVALEVLRVWGAPAALAAFNKAKGSTPPRPDVDLSDDPLANAVASDLKAATYIMQVPVLTMHDDLMADIAAGKVAVEAGIATLRGALPTR